MTDGPYRSLKLNRPWKDAAEALSEQATTIPEACELLAKAITNDVVNQNGVTLLAELKDIFGTTPQSHLFAADPSSYLEQVAAANSSPFNACLARHATLALAQGRNTEAGLSEALTQAVSEAANAGLQSIREHDTARAEDQAVLQYTRQRCGEALLRLERSEQRRVGQACVSTCRTLWSP